MKREALMQNPLPIDRVAARVVGKSRDVGLSPAIAKANGRNVEWAIAPPMKPPPESFRHWVGLRIDRLTLLGKLDFVVREDKPDANPRWVCRCDCGVHVIRNTRAIKKVIEHPGEPGGPQSAAWKCQTCVRKHSVFGAG